MAILLRVWTSYSTPHGPSGTKVQHGSRTTLTEGPESHWTLVSRRTGLLNKLCEKNSDCIFHTTRLILTVTAFYQSPGIKGIFRYLCEPVPTPCGTHRASSKIREARSVIGKTCVPSCKTCGLPPRVTHQRCCKDSKSRLICFGQTGETRPCTANLTSIAIPMGGPSRFSSSIKKSTSSPSLVRYP